MKNNPLNISFIEKLLQDGHLNGTTKQAARGLNREYRTLHTWLCKGTVPDGLTPFKIRNRWQWPLKQLLRFLKGGNDE